MAVGGTRSASQLHSIIPSSVGAVRVSGSYLRFARLIRLKLVSFCAVDTTYLLILVIEIAVLAIRGTGSA